MKLNRRKLTVVVVGAAVFVLLVTMVWAAPQATESVAPLEATPGFDADKVDGHHAVAASAPAADRSRKLLWANKRGQFSWGSMPQAALNDRYLGRNQTSLLALNPFEIEPTNHIAKNAGLRFSHHWLGYVEIWNETDNQGIIYIPVHNFTTVYGSALKLEGIKVCYQVTSGTEIADTKVYYADQTKGLTELLSNGTDRTSTTWDCYNASAGTPTLIEGPLLVYFLLNFDSPGSAHMVTIGQVTLTLTE